MDTPGLTARQSLIPDLSRMADVTVERANSALQAIERSSFLFGPPLAGLLIVLIGANNVLFLDAATFVVSAAVIASALPRRHLSPFFRWSAAREIAPTMASMSVSSKARTPGARGTQNRVWSWKRPTMSVPNGTP